MRDREAYHRHGRNDPLTPEQLQEHPYDFVSLPAGRPAAGNAIEHHRYFSNRLSGNLTLTYETLSPLHIGSGVFEAASECGLADGPTPVRGIVRCQGRPVLPGSGWKGAVRARFEAITRSRLGLADTMSMEPGFKVPEALKGPPSKHKVRIADPRVTHDLRPLRTVSHRDLPRLSPAEAVFGALGYRGRIHPGDGRIEGPLASRALRVAPLDGPVMHRLAKPGKSRNTGGSQIEIAEVEGRKFYYDGDIVHSRSRDGSRETYELIDYVPAGCTITLDVHLESFTVAEVGALLLSAGHGNDTGILRFGGYKPAGLGKVKLVTAKPQLATGSTADQWRRGTGELDLAAAVARAREQLVDSEALAELHAVTTRKRP